MGHVRGDTVPLMTSSAWLDRLGTGTALVYAVLTAATCALGLTPARVVAVAGRITRYSRAGFVGAVRTNT